MSLSVLKSTFYIWCIIYFCCKVVHFNMGIYGDLLCFGDRYHFVITFAVAWCAPPQNCNCSFLSCPGEIIQRLSHGNWTSRTRLKHFTTHLSSFISLRDSWYGISNIPFRWNPLHPLAQIGSLGEPCNMLVESHLAHNLSWFLLHTCLNRSVWLPKIHKEGALLKQNVGCINSVKYIIAKDLATILMLPVGHTDHHIQNSEEFASKIRHLKLDRDETVAACDVTSFFSSIPTTSALTSVRRRLEEDITLHQELPHPHHIYLLQNCSTTAAKPDHSTSFLCRPEALQMYLSWSCEKGILKSS